MNRARITAAVALAGVALTLGFWLRNHSDTDAGYETEPIVEGDIAATVTATGSVKPVTTVQVGTYVSGPILALDVDFNSPVRRGQRVAKIDPAPFVVKVQRAEANVANARARVEKANADAALKKLRVERFRELRAREFISQNDLDTAQSEYTQALAQRALDEASVRQADAELAETRINLSYTDITSPVDGIVVARNVDVGQTVAASFQTPTLFEIAQDLTKMQVNANVSESDIGGVREGQAATFTVDAYPERPFRGTVVQVRNAPLVVQNVVTYDVIISVDNPTLELKPGMTATVAIISAERRGVLKLPLRALSFVPDAAPTAPARARVATDGATAVWRLRADGTLEQVPVEAGLRDDQFAELRSGALRAGDPVVVARRRPVAQPTAARPFGMPRMR